MQLLDLVMRTKLVPCVRGKDIFVVGLAAPVLGEGSWLPFLILGKTGRLDLEEDWSSLWRFLSYFSFF